MAKSNFFHPADLYRAMSSCTTPFLFVADRPDIVSVLVQGYAEDMAKASRFISINEDIVIAIFILSNEKWARRVIGVYGNSLANAFPSRPHVICLKTGAAELVSLFATGGGRKAAAGINELPRSGLDLFFVAFSKQYAKHEKESDSFT
jgi:hypothetical protein